MADLMEARVLNQQKPILRKDFIVDGFQIVEAKAIGADVDKSARGLGIRSNRYTMLVDNLKVVKLKEEDDAGSCEVSAAENFIQLV